MPILVISKASSKPYPYGPNLTTSDCAILIIFYTLKEEVALWIIVYNCITILLVRFVSFFNLQDNSKIVLSNHVTPVCRVCAFMIVAIQRVLKKCFECYIVELP